MQDSHFSLVNKTRSSTPRLPFADMKNAVLGKRYDLSAALLTEAEARRITRTTKHKDKASNVLSFRLSKNSGELLLCPATARKQAASFDSTPQKFLARLFIHGLYHLKGYAHGATMERRERETAKRFRV